jgi:hypothetical protein
MTDHPKDLGWPDPQFDVNRDKVPLEVLQPYIGQYVAWSRDGTRILAAAGDREQLYKRLLADGIDPQRVVYDFIDDPDTSHF